MEPVTPKPGETEVPKAPENNPQPQAPIQGNASDNAGEAEKLRKELEQARMRENQLLNEKKAREEADEAKKAKDLEEQGEYKSLLEQEKAKREALEAERDADVKSRELAKARDEASKEYSDEVRSEAEALGITLNSTDEADVAAFKEKLERIQKRVGTTSKVGPNNPGKPTGQSELTGDDLKIALQDPAKFEEIVSKRPGIAMMMGHKKP